MPYFEEVGRGRRVPGSNGGSEAAAQDDFDFYSLAGQIEGDPATLKVEDFWDFGPLDRALGEARHQ